MFLTVKGRTVMLQCFPIKFSKKPDEVQKSSVNTNFMQQLMTLIETRKQYCGKGCINGICNKGKCLCNTGFEGERCETCTCMRNSNTG